MALALAAGFGVWSRWTEWPTQVVLRSAGDTWPLAFTPDSRTFATISPAALTLWDTQTGEERARWPNSSGATGGGAAFSPDGRTLALQVVAYPAPSSIALVDVTTGQVRFTLTTPHVGVFDLAFVAEGRQIRALQGDVPNINRLRTWDVATGTLVADVPITCPTKAFDSTLAPDGQTLALLPFNGNAVQLLDLASGQVWATIANPKDSSRLDRGLAFAPDGRTLAVGRQDGSIVLWDLATRQIRQRLRGHSGGFGAWGIRFAADGRSLVSQGVKIERSPFQMVFDAVGALMNGGQLALQPQEEVIAVDLTTGQTVARASSALMPVVSPDGRWVATRQADFSVRIRPNPVAPP